MTEPLVYSQEGQVVTLRLNEPKTRNALSPAIIEGLCAAVDRINGDLSVSCLVVTGEGSAFSSGGNVKEMYERTGFAAGGPATIRRSMMRLFQQLPLAFQRLEVPSIAAVNGAAHGGGLDLALMCDIRLAVPEAVFAESFIRLGVLSADGGAWLLPRLVGLSRAYELSLTGDPIDARTAAEYGLISRVVAREDLLPEAYRLAARIASHPPHSVRLTKRLVQQSAAATLEQSLELAAALQATLYHTEDQHEAVAAFIEKRPPSFKGG